MFIKNTAALQAVCTTRRNQLTGQDARYIYIYIKTNLYPLISIHYPPLITPLA
jgi:hypothetical protein